MKVLYTPRGTGDPKASTARARMQAKLQAKETTKAAGQQVLEVKITKPKPTKSELLNKQASIIGSEEALEMMGFVSIEQAIKTASRAVEVMQTNPCFASCIVEIENTMAKGTFGLAGALVSNLAKLAARSGEEDCMFKSRLISAKYNFLYAEHNMTLSQKISDKAAAEGCRILKKSAIELFEQSIKDSNWLIQQAGNHTCFEYTPQNYIINSHYNIAQLSSSDPELQKCLKDKMTTEKHYKTAIRAVDEIVESLESFIEITLAMNALEVAEEHTERMNAAIKIKALSLIAFGQDEKAIELFKTIIVNDSRCDDAFYMLAVCYYKLKNYAESLQNAQSASKCLEEGLKKVEKSEEVGAFINNRKYAIHMHIGLNLRHLGRFDEALEIFAYMLDFDINTIEVTYEMATTYSAKGDTITAKDLLQDIVSGNPHETCVLKSLADLHYADNEFDKALLCYQSFIKSPKSDKGDIDKANTNIGLIFCVQEKFDEGLAAFSQIPEATALPILIKIPSIKTQQAAASILCKQGRDLEALAIYQKMLAGHYSGDLESRDSIEDHIEVIKGAIVARKMKAGLELREAERYKDAIKIFNEALSLKEGSVDPIYEIGRTYEKMSDVVSDRGEVMRCRQMARLLMNQVLPHDPKDDHHSIYKVIIQLADSWYKDSEFDNALTLYHRAAKIAGFSAYEVQRVNHKISFTLNNKAKFDEEMACISRTISEAVISELLPAAEEDQVVALPAVNQDDELEGSELSVEHNDIASTKRQRPPKVKKYDKKKILANQAAEASRAQRARDLKEASEKAVEEKETHEQCSDSDDLYLSSSSSISVSSTSTPLLQSIRGDMSSTIPGTPVADSRMLEVDIIAPVTSAVAETKKLVKSSSAMTSNAPAFIPGYSKIEGDIICKTEELEDIERRKDYGEDLSSQLSQRLHDLQQHLGVCIAKLDKNERNMFCSKLVHTCVDEQVNASFARAYIPLKRFFPDAFDYYASFLKFGSLRKTLNMTALDFEEAISDMKVHSSRETNMCVSEMPAADVVEITGSAGQD